MGWGRVIAVWAVVTWVFFWRWRVFFWTRVLPLTRTRGKTKLQLPEGNRKKTNNKINVELIKQLHITCVFFFSSFSTSLTLALCHALFSSTRPSCVQFSPLKKRSRYCCCAKRAKEEEDQKKGKKEGK